VNGPVVLIVNPTKTDDLDRLRSKVTKQCVARGLPEPVLLETTESDTGAGQSHEAVRRGARVVLVAGGDGTVQAVCAGLAGTGVVLGLLPLGTGNLLARNLDVPLEFDQALTVALDGVSAPSTLPSPRLVTPPPCCSRSWPGWGSTPT